MFVSLWLQLIKLSWNRYINAWYIITMETYWMLQLYAVVSHSGPMPCGWSGVPPQTLNMQNLVVPRWLSGLNHLRGMNYSVHNPEVVDSNLGQIELGMHLLSVYLCFKYNSDKSRGLLRTPSSTWPKFEPMTSQWDACPNNSAIRNLFFSQIWSKTDNKPWMLSSIPQRSVGKPLPAMKFGQWKDVTGQ